MLQERLAPDLFAVDAVFLQRLLHDVLRGDARVVDAGDPERREALHSLEPDEEVLHGVLEAVPHVETPGDVGRRHGDHEGLLAALGDGVGVDVEEAAVFPVAVPRQLDGLGLVGRPDGRGRGRLRQLELAISVSGNVCHRAGDAAG